MDGRPKLPIPWAPGRGILRAAAAEAPAAEVRAYLQARNREPLSKATLDATASDIGPFMAHGKLVRVRYEREKNLHDLDELRVRFGLGPRATITPLGLVYTLRPPFTGAAPYENGQAGRLRLFLYLSESAETIDYCIEGHLLEEPDGPVFECRVWHGGFSNDGVVRTQGPFLRRQVHPFTWEEHDLLQAFDAEEAREDERHRKAIEDLYLRRATFYDGLPVYEAHSFNMNVHAPSHAQSLYAAPGALLTNNRDEVSAVVGAGGVFTNYAPGSTEHAELLFPDGRRRIVDIKAERWSGMPIWPAIGRAIVLERRLWPATIRGEGHFPHAGRHDNPWSFEIQLTSYEFAVRLAAALGWAKPDHFATGLSGERIDDPDLHEGQWVRVPYRRSTRWAQVCRIEDPWDMSDASLFLRDQEGRLYYLPATAIRDLNPDLEPPFLAGPVQEGIPESPALRLHLPGPPAPDPALPGGESA